MDAFPSQRLKKFTTLYHASTMKVAQNSGKWIAPAQRYFPGLIISPVVGVLGALLWLRLQALTTSSA
jgi:hypothetical protein